MKLTSLLLGLSLGSIGAAGFYAYSFDKSEYDWLAPQTLRVQFVTRTASLTEKTKGLRDKVEEMTGLKIPSFNETSGDFAVIADAQDRHGHDEENHNHDGQGKEKEPGHSEGDHDHGDHGTEKEHDRDEESHDHDNHGEEKERGHSEESSDHDDHGSEKAHDHDEEGHGHDDHGDEKERGHSEESRDHDDHGSEKAHDNDEEGHGHGDEDVVRLTKSQQEEFGVEIGYARSVRLGQVINLPGEVRYNRDRVAHIVPRVKGIVTTVSARKGDYVKAGDVLAVLESRELADIKAQYLASIGRLEIAQATFDREARLREEKISTEQAFLEAKGALLEAKIVLRTVQQQLYALGFSKGDLKQLRNEPDTALTAYQLIAPFDGRIINRHITLGETINDNSQAFVIADMTDLWVDFQIFPKDLGKVRQGQTVSVLNENGQILSESKIAFVASQIQEETRTGIARIQIPRTGNSLRPGMFVTAAVDIGSGDKVVTIPKTAPQIMNEKTVVFIQEGNGFEAQEVSLGRSHGDLIEVNNGLDLATPVVIAGAFVLKAQLSKAQFGDGHNH